MEGNRLHQVIPPLQSPLIPPDAFRNVSLLAELICFNSHQCVGFRLLRLHCVSLLSQLGDAEPSAADAQGFYLCQMMERNAVI